jgi:Zn-dependent M28 family amino/carboxypeptidase
MTTAAERSANVRGAGALGILNVDDLGFIVEPMRWPEAYARSVTLAPVGAKAAAGSGFLTIRISSLAFSKMVASREHEPGAILMASAAKLPLPNFDTGNKLTVKLKVAEREIGSPNILSVLPGTDAKLKDEYVVVAAHLDGYGFGTPVKGDNLYNGALDDAAYVALLIQMADDIKAGKLPRPKRSILFCAFTGEEKGLLGSNWFVEHPTVAKDKMVADVNLDQLRPLFPLNILTAEAVNDTTLGQTARDVGKPMGIEIRVDREPERGLLRRADQYPFLKIGVPAISFIFGYDPGTDAEKRYREWYEVRYHRPQDDVTQPMDFDAAAKFDQFFYKLVGAIADGAKRPEFLPGSQFAAKN